MSAIATLPQWCADIIANPPHSGDGFHAWLFRAARALWKCGRSEDDVRAFLESAAGACGRRVPFRELEDALENSRIATLRLADRQWQPWPQVNVEQRDAIFAVGAGLVDLWEWSPVRFENNRVHTQEIIECLFSGNPLLCVGAAAHDCRTAPLEEWHGQLMSFSLLVPNPMKTRTGRNQNGEVSSRCLDNTAARRFLVVEFDQGTTDEHAGLLLHLAQRAPLALAVFSGSKSLHGWFFCSGIDEEKVSCFFRYAVSLGADRATWTRCQLVRMPDALRDNGRRQVAYFFNPGVIV